MMRLYRFNRPERQRKRNRLKNQCKMMKKRNPRVIKKKFKLFPSNKSHSSQQNCKNPLQSKLKRSNNPKSNRNKEHRPNKVNKSPKFNNHRESPRNNQSKDRKNRAESRANPNVSQTNNPLNPKNNKNKPSHKPKPRNPNQKRNNQTTNCDQSTLKAINFPIIVWNLIWMYFVSLLNICLLE